MKKWIIALVFLPAVLVQLLVCEKLRTQADGHARLGPGKGGEQARATALTGRRAG